MGVIEGTRFSPEVIYYIFWGSLLSFYLGAIIFTFIRWLNMRGLHNKNLRGREKILMGGEVLISNQVNPTRKNAESCEESIENLPIDEEITQLIIKR